VPQNTDIINLVGLVLDPLANRSGDGATPPFVSGRSTELLVSELRGKFANATDRGHLFSANVTKVTMNVMSASYVSVFSLYNPVGSSVNLELVDIDIAISLATTVVNVLGLYYSTGNAAQSGTFTTQGSVISGTFGAPAAPQGQFYSAYTHSATPTRGAIVGCFPATAVTNNGVASFQFDGRVIIPPSTVVTVAPNVAVMTTTATDLNIRWLEYKNQ
jgi:hypothetical protein